MVDQVITKLGNKIRYPDARAITRANLKFDLQRTGTIARVADCILAVEPERLQVAYSEII